MHFYLLTLLTTKVEAAELFWDGMYRIRGQSFNSLSLSQTNPNAEGNSQSINHRLFLQPNWRVNAKVSIHAQLDILPYTTWGGEPLLFTDPTSTSTDAFFSQSYATPDFIASRAWAEVQTKYGIARMGRMPLHWGSGMVFNAGNEPLDEFGTTTDQVEFAFKLDKFFVTTAVKSARENFVNQDDDTWETALGLLYATERNKIGLYGNYRLQTVDEASFGLGTIDIAAETATGPLDADIEMAFNFGQGDLEGGLDNVRLFSFGIAGRANISMDKLHLGVGAGFASGDSDNTDKEFGTFQFHPDYHIALLMFEEPMPTLAAAVPSETNLGRNYTAVRTGYAVSNAIFITPKIGYTIQPNLIGELKLITAWAAALPEDESNNGYGVEIDASLYWTPYPNFEIQGTGALFTPGDYYNEYVDADLGGGFDQLSYGLQLMSTVSF